MFYLTRLFVRAITSNKNLTIFHTWSLNPFQLCVVLEFLMPPWILQLIILSVYVYLRYVSKLLNGICCMTSELKLLVCSSSFSYVEDKYT